MKFILLSLCCFLVFQSTSAKIFTRCELAKELLKQNFPRTQLESWVCLIENESKSNTNAKGGPNTNGSYDWGLFQINDKYWCKSGVVGGDCSCTCESLRTDDITKASACAKKIHARHGFSVWYAWGKYCKTGLPNLKTECGV